MGAFDVFKGLGRVFGGGTAGREPRPRLPDTEEAPRLPPPDVEPEVELELEVEVEAADQGDRVAPVDPDLAATLEVPEAPSRAEPPRPAGDRRPRLASWVEQRAHSVVSRIYDSRADDLEDRARRAVASAYRDQADDLEERAVRAMRRAITDESERIKEVIEHSVAVKKREVRLSLLVLIVAAAVYLALDLFVNRGGGS